MANCLAMNVSALGTCSQLADDDDRPKSEEEMISRHEQMQIENR